jgi:drug/metabolite transporter (DMT)-like permease
MTLWAFILIVASAGLHATWNMIAKKERMTIGFYAILGSIGAIWSSWVRFVTPIHFFAMPGKFYLTLAGMLAGEMCYGFGLVYAYRKLDMSSAYPMMRSLPLVFIAVLTMTFRLGDPLTPCAMIGMAVVFVGCLMMPLTHFSDFKLKNYLNGGMLFIILVACGTTLYTIFDKLSQNVMAEAFKDVSRPMRSMTYYSFRAVTLSITLWIVALSIPSTRAEVADMWRRRSWMPVLAGLCSSLTYVLVLMSMNFVSNVSYVQAFRQLGLPIGMLEGFLILKEKCTAPKVVGVVLILGGLALSVVKIG